MVINDKSLELYSVFEKRYNIKKIEYKSEDTTSLINIACWWFNIKTETFNMSRLFNYK